MTGVRIHAPAKINLGLAILGKRRDGYHEIDTIMAMIDLFDTITVHQVDAPGISVSGMDTVPLESNLITKAIRGWCERAGLPVAHRVDVVKSIPFPAGLGGGSSNAAAIILALNALHPDAVALDAQYKLAASLGADCPFFLNSACARATGIGTELQHLPAPGGWVVIIVPPANLQAKTAALYGALRPSDYGTVAQVDRIESALTALDSISLPNSFTRAALEVFPALTVATNALTSVAGTWSLSGAGPAVFAVTSSEAEARRWKNSLATMLPPEYAVHAARFLSDPPRPELLP